MTSKGGESGDAGGEDGVVSPAADQAAVTVVNCSVNHRGSADARDPELGAGAKSQAAVNTTVRYRSERRRK